jgi:hypothetical protein
MNVWCVCNLSSTSCAVPLFSFRHQLAGLVLMAAAGAAAAGRALNTSAKPPQAVSKIKKFLGAMLYTSLSV